MIVSYAHVLGTRLRFTLPLKKRVRVASRDVLWRASGLIMRVLNRAKDATRQYVSPLSVPVQPGSARSALSIMRSPYKPLEVPEPEPLPPVPRAPGTP